MLYSWVYLFEGGEGSIASVTIVEMNKRRLLAQSNLQVQDIYFTLILEKTFEANYGKKVQNRCTLILLGNVYQ